MKSSLKAAAAGLTAVFTLNAGVMAQEKDPLIDQAVNAVVALPDGGLHLNKGSLLDNIMHIGLNFVQVMADRPPLNPLIETTPARNMMTRIASALVKDPEGRSNLESFLADGGTFHLYTGPSSYSGLFTTNKPIAIYMNSDNGEDQLVVTADHELEHHNRLIHSRIDDKDFTALTFADYFKYRFFDEALAQATATDFAYQLYLQGDAKPLQSLLDQKPYKDDKTGELTLPYMKAIALEYLGTLNQLDGLPEPFDLSRYPKQPSSADLPYEKRRAMAMASAFEAWLTSGILPAYAETAAGLLRATYKDIGHDATIDAWVEGDTIKANIGTLHYTAEDMKAEFVIDGINFFSYVKPDVLGDGFMLNTLPPEISMDAQKIDDAARAYNAAGAYPVVTLDPAETIYDAAQAQEYKDSGYRQYASISDYFNDKAGGLLDYVIPYHNNRGDDDGIAISIEEFAKATQQGLIPPLSYSVPSMDDTMPLMGPGSVRAQFERRVLSYYGDAGLYRAGTQLAGDIMGSCKSEGSEDKSGCNMGINTLLGRMIRETLALDISEVDPLTERLANIPDIKAGMQNFETVLSAYRAMHPL